MSKSSEAVKRSRSVTKSRIVESMGGCCQICNYNRCHNALELHHIDPLMKEFSMSKVRANCISWKRLIEELRKCILLCSNCHKEIHAGIIELPEIYSTFNENFSEYEINTDSFCPVCGKMKDYANKTCSAKCGGSLGNKMDWDEVDLESLFIKYKTYNEIGRILDISASSVRARLIKIGLVDK